MVKLWEVSQHSCDMQVEMQKEGVVCSNIAYAIHKHQVEQGVQKYAYHRPAHGQAGKDTSSGAVSGGLHDARRTRGGRV